MVKTLCAKEPMSFNSPSRSWRRTNNPPNNESVVRTGHITIELPTNEFVTTRVHLASVDESPRGASNLLNCFFLAVSTPQPLRITSQVKARSRSGSAAQAPGSRIKR